GKPLWSTDITPEDEANAVVSGAVSVYGGRVFVSSGYAEVLALDAESGKILWRTPLTAPVRAAPTVAGDRVFITTVDNQLVALSAEDGKKIWDHSGISESAG